MLYHRKEKKRKTQKEREIKRLLGSQHKVSSPASDEKKEGTEEIFILGH